MRMDYATVDQLSGGRLDFGVGKGYRYNEFAGFCVPIPEADERGMWDASDVARKTLQDALRSPSATITQKPMPIL